MKHDFRTICYNNKQLFDGVQTLNKFMKNLSKQSYENLAKWTSEDYKGKGFEALIEVLIYLSPICKKINIDNYEPVLKHDYGIDGIGTSHNGNIHTVQIKFRNDKSKMLCTKQNGNEKDDGISNFVAHSITKYGDKVDMTVFTTAKGFYNNINENMYEGKVRTLGYKQLSKLVDNCPKFWKVFKETLDK